ncbi:MAG: GGDEF domain-containing protein [Acidimicrobiales bacterium]
MSPISLRDSEFAEAVLDALPDATAVLDCFGTIVAVNRVWKMFAIDNGGTPQATGVGVNYLEVCERAFVDGCADAGEVLRGLRSVLNGKTVESDWEYPCPSPTVGRWFTSRITPIEGPTGGAVISHVNISRRKMSEEQLTHRASHDPLTGLANRVLFTEKLTEMLSARAGRSPVADCGLLYIDLDNFKPVNDTFGHDAGDEVLLQVAHRLRSQMRPQDTAARLGGDEFAVCVPRIDQAGLSALATRIAAALDAPHQIHGRQVKVGGSVGAHLANPGASVDAALRQTDQAMYAMKNARRAGAAPNHEG